MASATIIRLDALQAWPPFSILAAAAGIPALVALGPEVLRIADGTELILEAEARRLQVNPEPGAGAAAERGMRFSHVITTGNQVGLGFVDYLRYLGRHPGVNVIACYVEGFSDGRALLGAMREAVEAGKRVIVLETEVRGDDGKLAAKVLQTQAIL